MRCVVPGSVEDTCGALDEECRRQTWYCGRPMPRPTNSEAPALFWFYRLVGIGAIVGAVALSKRNDSDPYAEVYKGRP